MELWKSYRAEIEKNISLQEAARNSDQRFQVLEKKLLGIMPRYHEKYKSELSSVAANTSSPAALMEYDVSEVEKILDDYEKVVEDHIPSFSAIDAIDFHSAEMNDIVAEVQKGKIVNIDYVDVGPRTQNFEIPVIKKIALGENVKKLRIAIDGPSGSGKSTIAKLIAAKHGLNYINTGLIYRAIALNALNLQIDIDDEKEVVRTLVPNMIELKPKEVVFLNNNDVTKALRSDLVSQTASKVASIAKVREYALTIARRYAKIPGTVMDGRDTTFKIMPDADLKIFLDTSPEVRAKRRVDQNRILGFGTDYDKILAEIKERDHRDVTRAVDPLHKVEDAHLIDASSLSIEEVVQEIEKLVAKKG